MKKNELCSKSNNVNHEDILKYLLKKNTLSLEEVADKIEEMKNQDILSQHPYSITQNKDGRYSTYLPQENGASKRKKIIKPSKELLEKEIIKFYKEREKQNSIQNITLRLIYPQMLNYVGVRTDSGTYLKRIDEYWRKYFLSQKIIDVPLIDLDYYQLNLWAHSIVREHKLTKKQYSNMVFILRQSLDLAIEKNILSENLFSKVHIDSKLFRPIKKKADETQVFLEEEQPLIEKAAYEDFECTKADACLVIPFLFQTGMRVSEVCALKWSDVDGNYIYIQRMVEKKYQKRDDGTWKKISYHVIDRTKSYAGERKIYLTTDAREILNKVRKYNEELEDKNSEYIFRKNGNFMSMASVDRKLRTYCHRCNIQEKSLHKIRKTFISTLIESRAVSIKYVQECVGHASAQTTYKSYYFDRKSKNVTEKGMEEALTHKV